MPHALETLVVQHEVTPAMLSNEADSERIKHYARNAFIGRAMALGYSMAPTDIDLAFHQNQHGLTVTIIVTAKREYLTRTAPSRTPSPIGTIEINPIPKITTTGPWRTSSIGTVEVGPVQEPYSVPEVTNGSPQGLLALEQAEDTIGALCDIIAGFLSNADDVTILRTVKAVSDAKRLRDPVFPAATWTVGQPSVEDIDRARRQIDEAYTRSQGQAQYNYRYGYGERADVATGATEGVFDRKAIVPLVEDLRPAPPEPRPSRRAARPK